MNGVLVSHGCDFLTCELYPFQALEEVQFAIRVYAKTLSYKTIAQSFDIDLKTLVKVARWNDSKPYKRPIPSLVKELHAEIKADFE